MLDNLARAARVYFDFADANTQAGKTRDEFAASCALTQYARETLRRELEKYESEQA